MGITELCPSEDDLFDAPEIVPANAKKGPEFCRCGEGEPHPPVVRNGSYWIPDITFTGPATGRDVRCMRASNGAKYLADLYAISQYDSRMTAAGAAQQNDEAEEIRAEIRTLDPKGTNAEKKRLNQLADALQRLAGSKVEADRGTFMHSLLEQVIAGTAVADLKCTDSERADTEALLKMLANYGIVLQPQYAERVVVWQQMRIGGRVDGLAEYRGALEVVDLKTGADPFLYGEKEIIAQQLGYASMDAFFSCGFRTFEPRPDRLRYDRSLILVSPYGQAKPYVKSLDLAAARPHWIKAFEAKKFWLKMPGLSQTVNPRDRLRDLPLEQRIAAAITQKELLGLKREAGSAWTADLQTQAVAQLAVIVAARSRPITG